MCTRGSNLGIPSKIREKLYTLSEVVHLILFRINQIAKATTQWGSSSEDESKPRTKRDPRHHKQSNDNKVEVQKFQGKLDPNEFIHWLHTIERVFDYKDVRKDKNVKPISLKLRKYALSWWNNYMVRQLRKEKKRSKLGPKWS